MRALVTGGAGFIGSNLCDRLLAEGIEVDAVDDLSSGSLINLTDARNARTRRFSFHRLDVRSQAVSDLILHRKPDIVFHLAAQANVGVSVAKPAFDAEVNVIGSLNVLEGAVRAKVRKVVFASTAGIYGAPETLPLREGNEQHPISPYGVAKKAIGEYLYYYREVQGLEYTTLLLSNVFGPRQNPGGEAGVVAIFAAHLLRNEQPSIYGDGDQTRDFVFVDDVVDAFAKAMEKGSGLAMNVGTGEQTSVQQLYETMAKIVGFNEPPRYAPPRLGEIRDSVLDSGRAELHLGWKPFTPLEDGLTKTINWMRMNLHS